MLDPSIILAASQNQPKFQSPLDTFQKAMALRELVNQSQLSDLAAKQQQQQYGDQQSLRTLLQGNPNPSAQQVYGAAGPQVGTQFLNSMTEYKTKLAAQAKAQGDVALQSADFLGRGAGLVQKSNYDPKVAIQTLQSAQGTPFEQQANGYIQQIQQDPTQVKPIFDRLATQAESLKDQETAATAAKTAAAQQQKADAATTNALINKAKADKESGAKDLATVGALFGNAQNQNDWAMAFARAQAAGVSKSVLNTIPTAFSPTTAQSIAKQAIPAPQAASLAQTAQQNKIQDSLAAARLNEERRHNGVTEQMSNGQQWSTPADIPPAQAAYVDRVFAGKDVAPGPNSKQRGAFNTAMSILHPDYDFTTGVERKATAQNISSGQFANKAVALNTFVGHVADLKGAIDQMGNGDVARMNQIAQAWGKETGHSNVTNFETFRDAATGELVNLLATGGATEGEIQHARASMATAQSPSILKQRMNGLLMVAGSKGAAIQDQVRRQGKITDYQVYNPQNRAVMQQNGVDPDTGMAAQQKQQSAPTNRKPLSAIFGN